MARRRFNERKPRDNFEEVADMARSAYRIGQEIKDLINVEQKRLEITSIGAAAANTQLSFNGTTPVTLNNPSQGVADNQRTGDSIKCQTLTLRWYHQVPPAFAGARVPVRFVLFWQEDNTTPQLLVNIFRTMGNANAVISPKDYDNRFNTKILHMRDYLVEGNDLAGGADYGSVHEHIEKIDKHTQFDGGLILQVTGRLAMAWISPDNGASPITVNYEATLSFTDD
jgi:hypothetical protein